MGKSESQEVIQNRQRSMIIILLIMLFIILGTVTVKIFKEIDHIKKNPCEVCAKSNPSLEYCTKINNPPIEDNNFKDLKEVTWDK